MQQRSEERRNKRQNPRRRVGAPLGEGGEGGDGGSIPSSPLQSPARRLMGRQLIPASPLSPSRAAQAESKNATNASTVGLDSPTTWHMGGGGGGGGGGGVAYPAGIRVAAFELGPLMDSTGRGQVIAVEVGMDLESFLTICATRLGMRMTGRQLRGSVDGGGVGSDGERRPSFGVGIWTGGAQSKEGGGGGGDGEEKYGEKVSESQSILGPSSVETAETPEQNREKSMGGAGGAAGGAAGISLSSNMLLWHPELQVRCLLCITKEREREKRLNVHV